MVAAFEMDVFRQYPLIKTPRWHAVQACRSGDQGGAPSPHMAVCGPSRSCARSETGRRRVTPRTLKGAMAEADTTWLDASWHAG